MVEIPKFPELTFDEATHLYRLRGAELPSVTTVMKPLSSEVYGGVDEWVMERAAGRGTAVLSHYESEFVVVPPGPTTTPPEVEVGP